MRNKYINFSTDSSLLFIRDKVFVPLKHEICQAILPNIQQDTNNKRVANCTLAKMQIANDMKNREALVKDIKRIIKSTAEKNYMTVQVHNTSNSTGQLLWAQNIEIRRFFSHWHREVICLNLSNGTINLN